MLLNLSDQMLFYAFEWRWEEKFPPVKSSKLVSKAGCLEFSPKQCFNQGRKSSWTELNELNWKNWTEALGRHGSNWTERTGSRPDQADELNWTNFFESTLNWICVTLSAEQTWGEERGSISEQGLRQVIRKAPKAWEGDAYSECAMTIGLPKERRVQG